MPMVVLCLRPIELLCKEETSGLSSYAAYRDNQNVDFWREPTQVIRRAQAEYQPALTGGLAVIDDAVHQAVATRQKPADHQTLNTPSSHRPMQHSIRPAIAAERCWAGAGWKRSLHRTQKLRTARLARLDLFTVVQPGWPWTLAVPPGTSWRTSSEIQPARAIWCDALAGDACDPAWENRD
jgi:hypothetical protein